MRVRLFWKAFMTVGLAVASFLASLNSTLAQEPPALGGPDQVDNQLESDASAKKPLYRFGFLDPYFAYKTRLKEHSRFGFGVDYSTVYLKASESPGEDKSASGMIRFYGAWELVGRESGNTGAFV